MSVSFITDNPGLIVVAASVRAAGDAHAKSTTTDRRGSFGPEALRAACDGFEAAWNAIASHFKAPTDIEAARLTLASAILSVTDNTSRDVESLKHLGLQAMARKYASASPSPADIQFSDEKHWRNKAEETRQLSPTFDPDPTMIQGLLEISRGYDRLADLMRERDHARSAC